MFHDIHPLLTTSSDRNNYTLGRMSLHDIVITTMPEAGNSSSALIVHRPQNMDVQIHITYLLSLPSQRQRWQSKKIMNETNSPFIEIQHSGNLPRISVVGMILTA